MPRLVVFFAFLFVAFAAAPAFSAGYSCPAYMKYTSCSAGYYMTNGGSYNGTAVAGNACTACPAGYTCAGGTANMVASTRSCAAGTYWNGSACANCGGDAYYCPGFSNISNPGSGYGRNGVSAGYYSTGGGATTRTGQAQCSGTTYCTGGVANKCPTANSSLRTSFPATYYSPTVDLSDVQSASGRTAVTACSALNWYTSTRGSLYEYVNYNANSGKYDATSSYGWHDVNAGYYLLDRGGCGSYAYYLTISDCPAGSYCPGKYRVACNAGNQATVHTTTFGLETCPGTYSKSAVNAKSSAYCYLTTSSTKYVATASAGEVSCAAGYACSGGTTVYYAAGVGATTGGITSCTGTTYSGAGAGSCAACPAGYTANTASNKTAATQCQINVGGGQYMATAGSGGSVACAAGTSKPAHTLNYGATSACAACTGATYSEAGAASCAACPAGYTANTASNKTAVAQCQISCAAGTRVVNPETACTTPSGGWFTAAHLINYRQISPVNFCTTGFISSGTTAAAHDAMSDCVKTVAAGKYIPATTAQGRYVRIGSSGSTANSGHHVVEVQAFSSSNATGANMLAGKNALSASRLPGGATDGSWFRNDYTECSGSPGCVWDIGSVVTIGSIKFALYTDGRTYNNVTIAVSNDNINWTTVLGPIEILTQVIETSVGDIVVVSSSDTTCAAGTANPSQSVALGSTSSCAACTGTTYSGAGAGSCAACPAGYTANTASNKTAAAQCQINVGGGQYMATAGSGGSVACAAGTSKPAHIVNYGSLSSCAACTAGTYSGAGAGSCTGCPAIPGDNYVGYNQTPSSDAGSGAVTSCFALNMARWATNGYWSNGNTRCYYTNSDYTNCTKTYANCQVGYHLDSSNPPAGFANSCKPCGVGSYSFYPGGIELWNPIGGTSDPSYGISYAAESCTLCAAGTYQDATGQPSCKSCPTGSNVQPVYGGFGTWNWDRGDPLGSYQVNSCYKTNIAFTGAHCVGTHSRYWTSGSDANAYYNSGTPGPTYATSCDGGYYAPASGSVYTDKIDGETVGAGYYSPAGSITRTACDAGTTTIGSGAGADEAADCGRRLHIGDSILYLRSAKKTTPSLNVGVNGTIYYGNMTPGSSKGALRVNYGGTTYSVHDDSM